MNVMPTSCWMLLELDLHLLAQLQVERAQRLVEQQHRGLVHDRARQRDALALPARELAPAGGRRTPQSHHLERLVALAALASAPA